MDNRGDISPGAIYGAIITLVTAAVVGMIGLRLLSPFATRCDDSGVFTDACNKLTLSLGDTIADLVGPLGLMILLVSLLLVIASQGR
ncbi:hypothetical protein [Halorubrum depositum]|uniref:hypothetical protein n=1 Tax=Halorubrum depositum TaxID=2583992 RepID=UPI0011A1A483|nr:hypothetical protein [Halorubrum depositum]